MAHPDALSVRPAMGDPSETLLELTDEGLTIKRAGACMSAVVGGRLVIDMNIYLFGRAVGRNVYADGESLREFPQSISWDLWCGKTARRGV